MTAPAPVFDLDETTSPCITGRPAARRGQINLWLVGTRVNEHHQEEPA